MQIEQINVKDLIPYANNARTHSDSQIKEIAASIKEFGFNVPVLLDGKNGLIAGHGRVKAAELLSMNTVPAIQIKHLTEAQKRAYILADNRIALNAGWDAGLLKIEFEQLLEVDFDMSLMGFEEDEIKAYMNPEVINDGQCDEDEIPEFTKEPESKLGDIWILGEHRLMCGDSTMIDDVEKLITNIKIDMVYCDPPYGINLDTNYKKRYGHEKASISSQFYGEDNGIDLKSIIDQSLNIPELFIWGADNYPDCLARGGSWIVWDKSVLSIDGVASDFELCWSRERHNYSMFRKLWKLAKAREETGQEGDHKTRWGHPTQKPIELAVFFFEKWGKKAKNILDYFGGSGTTLIACEKTNRKCFMMEISPAYCDIIINRWQKFTGRKAILESTGEAYGEKENSV